MIYLLFLVNLSVTSLVEGAIVFLLFKKWDFVYYSLLCNLLTNPAMNLLLLIAVKTAGSAYYGISLVFLETAVVFVEAFLYKILGNLKMPKALLLSVTLNLASFICGILAEQVFHG